MQTHTNTCPQCGAKNPASSTFCHQCSLYLKPLGVYQLHKALAEGASGRVYMAENRHTGHRVAIKFPHHRLDPDKEEQERFVREAKLLTQFRHPHVVNVFGSGVETELGPYLVMEWLEGKTLYQTLTSHAPQGLPIAEALKWLSQLLDGLHHIHQAGVIHRDIKPQNLMLVGAEGQQRILQILDFGTAKAGPSGRTHQEGLLGTPHFMAPEQIHKKHPISPATDLYAVGLLLAWMLTGKFVFEGQTIPELCHKQCIEQPKSLSELAGRPFPADLEKVVARTLQKHPEHRYPGAMALLKDLPTHSATPSPQPPLQTPSSRQESLVESDAFYQRTLHSSSGNPPKHPISHKPSEVLGSEAPSKPSFPLESEALSTAPLPPGGSYQPRWYIPRIEAEQDAALHLATPGSPVILWSPELFGKTWMLKHLVGLSQQQGWQVAELSLARLDEDSLSSLDNLLMEFALLLVEKLDLPEEWVTQAWKRPGNVLRKLNWLVEKKILPAEETPVLLAIDRVDAIRGRAYEDDFFGLLRSWAEDANQEPWSRLRLVLAVSTTPTLLIEQSKQSPFNLTPPIHLGDFTFSQVQRLCSLYRLDWDEAALHQVMEQIGGHPYLLRLLFYTAAVKGVEASELLEPTHPLFHSYLARSRKRLMENKHLEQAMRGILEQSTEQVSPSTYHRLYKAGLILASEEGQLLPRYKLYKRLFDHPTSKATS